MLAQRPVRVLRCFFLWGAGGLGMMRSLLEGQQMSIGNFGRIGTFAYFFLSMDAWYRTVANIHRQRGEYSP